MAHMTQEKKKAIAEELKKVVPKNWKYSLRVRHHTTIVFTLRSGPKEIIQKLLEEQPTTYCWNINDYYPEHSFTGETLETVRSIIKCLNTGNFDNSDSQTDYFHVGHYVNFYVGEWDKPFEVIE